MYTYSPAGVVDNSDVKYCVEICNICWFWKVWTVWNICQYPNSTNPSVIPKCLSQFSIIIEGFSLHCILFISGLSAVLRALWFTNLPKKVYSVKVFNILNPLAFVFCISAIVDLCFFVCFWSIPHIIAFCWLMLQWLLIRASFTINGYSHYFISAIQCSHGLANDIYRLINKYSQSTLAY